MAVDRLDQLLAFRFIGEGRKAEQFCPTATQRHCAGLVSQPRPDRLADSGQPRRIGMFVDRGLAPSKAREEAQAASFLSTYCKIPPLR